jgi:hypothetical protein
LLGVEQWAEIRRMSKVERLSQREIHRRTGVHRDTIRKALASPEPPSYGPRSKRPSKLDPFVGAIEELVVDEPALSGVPVREELERLGYDGGRTILDELLRELRPPFFAAAAQLSAHPLPPWRAGPVRPLRAALCDPGRLGSDPPRLRRDLRAALLARLRRRAGVLEAVLRHRVRDVRST